MRQGLLTEWEIEYFELSHFTDETMTNSKGSKSEGNWMFCNISFDHFLIAEELIVDFILIRNEREGDSDPLKC